MSSTLPKYVQAANSSNQESGGSAAGSAETKSDASANKLRCREFIDKYKTLPDDFLRIPSSYYSAALAAQHEQSLIAQADLRHFHPHSPGPLVDMIDISVVEAQLVKNYGLLRMDLYCKIRVGHYVAETATCTNGARNPKWDNSGVYQFAVKPGIDSFHLEIYDEKQFSSDEKIAWLHEPIPPEIFQGITVERWFPLSGRLGPQKEGSILLVLSHKRVPMRASNFGRTSMLQHQEPMGMFLPPPPTNQPRVLGGPTVLPVDPNVQAYIQPPPVQTSTAFPTQQTSPSPGNGGGGARQQAQATVRTASEEDINQLSEMFPSIGKSVIKSVLENHNLEKESAISALLAMV